MKSKLANKVLLEAASQEITDRLSGIKKGTVATDPGDLEDILDHALLSNRRIKRGIESQIRRTGSARGADDQYENIMVVGQPGGGKTGIIEAWAASRDVNLVKFTGAELDADMAKGMPVKAGDDPNTGDPQVKMVSTDVWNRLIPADDDDRDVVLFIDEINRSYKEAEGAILTLVQSHEANLSNKTTKFDKLLFVIAAMNPPGSNPQLVRANGDVREVGFALRTRFKTVLWNGRISKSADYWFTLMANKYDSLNADLADGIISQEDFDDDKAVFDGQKRIIEALSDSKANFAFSTDSQMELNTLKGGLGINARTLWTAISHCNGQFGEIDPVILDDNDDNYTNYSASDAQPNGSFLCEFIANCKPSTLELRNAIEAWDMYMQSNPAAFNNASNSISKSMYVTWNNWYKDYKAGRVQL